MDWKFLFKCIVTLGIIAAIVFIAYLIIGTVALINLDPSIIHRVIH